ncbi:site-specific DNA-methyltransferase [Brachybacterium sp. Marseille-Q2903]|uniref:Site-specific DNA-methyltransferase n=1 Tax=Brachybacterium epidermidis TaxID=2781983 RepID=A0ABR9W011_9MICO|nr:site-specific DNA-methyltransferase [Brachybacterium epidermidis]
MRRGDKVRVLPPRGETKTGDQRLWRVTRIERADGQRLAHLAELDAEEPAACSVPADDVVVVAEFRDRVYPGLVETGRVERGGDKPFHSVINAENYHALEMLTYTHRHSIDAIYIDPPYNTGAKDWKYNNNYVEGDDDYRHSKWLAFMERRLKIARELLNPEDSVLIVTIDEKEYLRLGLLLEQTFPEARVQMVSVGINPAPPSRNGMFGRADEFYFFVLFGIAGVQAAPLGQDWITAKGRTHKGQIRWDLLRKSGASPTREGHPDTFYPFFITEDGARFHSVGNPIGVGASREDTLAPPGTVAVWPIRQNGTEGRWRLQPSTARRVMEDGGLRIGAVKGERTPIYYLSEGEREKIKNGLYQVLGRGDDGSVITSTLESSERWLIPGTQWRVGSHDSTQYGSRLLAKLLPDRKFPFPKSLYAVEDSLRFFLANKPQAVVLDFFSGSGTTAHAVMRLNRQDGGHRRSISVTNNEVSADEQVSLRKQGLRPGDAEWENLGICDFITKPRLTTAITGKTPQGEPVKGDYKFTDEFPMSEGFEENAAFFTLTYEAPLSVRHNRAFERVAPMLWLRAGSRGRVIYDLGEDGWDVADSYGVLENLDQADEFVATVSARECVDIAFVVTDDDSAFQMVCRELPNAVVPVRLYESYLQNFEINTGRSL